MDRVDEVKPSRLGLARRFFEPQPAITVAWIRILIFSFFIYKLACRAFSNFGMAPEEALSVYPAFTGSFAHWHTMLGLPWIIDLATFHWIHWLIPLPGVGALQVIQLAAMGACLAVVLLGKGPRNLYAVSAYVLLAYLWGYVWRSGANADAIFMQLQAALVYCFFRGREALVVGGRTSVRHMSRRNGWLYSMMLLIFICYYFTAGVSKLVDIAPMDWFQFELLETAQQRFHNASVCGGSISFAPWTPYVPMWSWCNPFLVAPVYLMELSIPLIFFYRRMIPAYWVFFSVFHFMCWMLGILFFGDIIFWCALAPVHRLLPRVTVAQTSAASYPSRRAA